MIGDHRVAFHLVGAFTLGPRIVVQARVADREDAERLGPRHVGPAQVADVGGLVGTDAAQAVERMLEDPGIGLERADLVAEGPVVEEPQDLVFGQVAA